MALDERSRHQLFLRLEGTLGAEAATTLMEHLPPVGWADVATKHDLDQVAALTKHDLDQVAALTKRDLDQLAALTKRDLDQLATLNKVEHDHLADRLIRAVHEEILTHVAGQNRAIALVIGTILSTATLALAAAHFF